MRQFGASVGGVTGAFRAMFYPSIKLGSHWYGYSAVEVNSEPYYYWEAYSNSREVNSYTLQAFVGYSRSAEKTAISIKAGKLASAFGSFPLRYDDTANPLLDMPVTYGTWLGIRADQLPCGINDLLRQRSYRFVRFSCGGSKNLNYWGIWPETVYGIPGAELDFSYNRIDGRLQITNSSPANPHSFLSDSQNVQWTAGAGYTIRQGFRVGFSAFRGPWLDEEVGDLLPAGKGYGDYPASGEGIDVQWARGRWSATGELQWLQYRYPGFRTSPAIYSEYIEAKAILSPRFYAAIRTSFQQHNRPEDLQRLSSKPFQPNLQYYEFALGLHLNHFQTLKLGYEWVRAAGIPGNRENVIGVQIVTSINSLTKAFK